CMNISNANVQIPDWQVKEWARKQANDTAKQRKGLIRVLEEIRIKQETDLPPLRAATAQARENEEVALAAYRQAQAETLEVYTAEIDAVATLERERSLIERELRSNAPGVIAETIEKWNREFRKELIPSVIDRVIPGRFDGTGQPMRERSSNFRSIEQRKLGLCRAIEAARAEVPLKAVTEKDAIE